MCTTIQQHRRLKLLIAVLACHQAPASAATFQQSSLTAPQVALSHTLMLLAMAIVLTMGHIAQPVSSTRHKILMCWQQNRASLTLRRKCRRHLAQTRSRRLRAIQPLEAGRTVLQLLRAMLLWPLRGLLLQARPTACSPNFKQVLSQTWRMQKYHKLALSRVVPPKAPATSCRSTSAPFQVVFSIVKHPLLACSHGAVACAVCLCADRYPRRLACRNLSSWPPAHKFPPPTPPILLNTRTDTHAAA